jgi:hypothetical protein
LRISSVPGRIPNGSQRSYDSIELLELRGEPFEDGAQRRSSDLSFPKNSAAAVAVSVQIMSRDLEI